MLRTGISIPGNRKSLNILAGKHVSLQIDSDRACSILGEYWKGAASGCRHAIYLAGANLVSLFNPDMIVFGGGVFGPGQKYLDRIDQEACRWAQPISIRQVKFVPSKLGESVALYGAAYLAMDL